MAAFSNHDPCIELQMNTVRFRSAPKENQESHGNYLPLKIKNVPKNVSKITLFLLEHDSSNTTHKNWLCIIPLERKKLDYKPAKTEKIVFDVSTELLKLETSLGDGCEEPDNKKRKKDLFGANAWNFQERELVLGKGAIQMNIIKNGNEKHSRDNHRARLGVQFDTGNPIISDVIYDADLYEFVVDAVEPKQICVKGEHVLSVTLRNAKMQKNLNFVLMLVNEKGETILQAKDHVRFPNGLIKFLIGDISAYINPNTEFNVLVTIEDYIAPIQVIQANFDNPRKLTIKNHDSAAQSWCQCVTSSVEEFRNNYGDKRFNVNHPLVMFVNQLVGIETWGYCQCAKILCQCIAQDGISNFSKIQKKALYEVHLNQKSPWYKIQDLSEYFPLKFFMLPIFLCILTLCLHM